MKVHCQLARGAIGVPAWSPSRACPLLSKASPNLSISPRRSRSPRRTLSPQPSSSRHTILFLPTNPGGTTGLALDEECSAIEHELRMTPGRDDFDFRSKWAVSIDEMMRHLNECQPTIVHFSGHGSGSADIYVRDRRHPPFPPHRDIEVATDTGIHLQDDRRSQYVSERALAQMIASAAPSTRLVVLNACFSNTVAESLRTVVDCVVGMDGAIGDDAARSFAVGFYRALGNRRSIGNAIAQAIATLAAKQLPDARRPVCRTRDGVSADQLFLPNSIR
jgi:hypothetical protein